MIKGSRVGNKILELTKRPELSPPFGDRNKVVTAAEKYVKSIQWSIDSLDWQELGQEQ